MSDIKLVYFDVRGRAEPLRLTLAAAGKSYEDFTFEGEEKMAEEKTKSPYGQFPYLVYKGKTYGESKAMASFVARECGLAGKTSEEAMRVDEVYCLVATLLEEIANEYMEKDAAKRYWCYFERLPDMQKKLTEVTVPKFLSYFEKMLKENATGYLAGSALTQADLSVYDIAETVVKRDSKALDKCPEVQKLQKTVESNAKVKAYIDSRKPHGI